MALFAVTLNDQSTDVVEGADAYQQEGPLTTFFALRNDRQVIDSWSVRMASYRTADIAAIRRSTEPAEHRRDRSSTCEHHRAEHTVCGAADGATHGVLVTV